MAGLSGRPAAEAAGVVGECCDVVGMLQITWEEKTGVTAARKIGRTKNS